MATTPATTRVVVRWLPGAQYECIREIFSDFGLTCGYAEVDTPHGVIEVHPGDCVLISDDDTASPPTIVPLGEYAHCHGGRDGDCFWKHCPQLRDNEPEQSGRHCPLDNVILNSCPDCDDADGGCETCDGQGYLPLTQEQISVAWPNGPPTISERRSSGTYTI